MSMATGKGPNMGAGEVPVIAGTAGACLESGVRSTVLAAMERYKMVPPGGRVIVAVSGGQDSVCLVHLLRDLSGEAGFALAGIAHFNHRLRGQESDEDESFVRRLAESLNVPFFCASAETGGEVGNLEQNARRARKRFYKELLQAGAADRVALGHTRDDQAETVLFRILRGTGTAGLAGILPVTAEGLIRPLLDVQRSEVRAYLRERGIAWREDSSNLSTKFARNRIRAELLPRLERDWNPQLTQALANLADVAFEEERHWASELERAAVEFQIEPGSVVLPARLLASEHRALSRRIARLAIRTVKGSLVRIDFDHVETLLELAARSGSGRVRIPGVVATRSFEWLRLAVPSAVQAVAPLAVSDSGVYPWGQGKLMINLGLSSSRHPRNPCDTLRVEFRPEGLELRPWRPGDQYWPEGASRVWSVKELFQKARVPSWQRASWPILTSKDKIFWVKQFGPARDADGIAVHELS